MQSRQKIKPTYSKRFIFQLFGVFLLAILKALRFEETTDYKKVKAFWAFRSYKIPNICRHKKKQSNVGALKGFPVKRRRKKALNRIGYLMLTKGVLTGKSARTPFS